MPVVKLTKHFADNVLPTLKRDYYYDRDLKGFCLKVVPSGSKRWCVEYRPGAGGRRVAKRRVVLGSISAVTADEARTTARKMLATIALGEDPGALRREARSMPTFREFSNRYLMEEAKAKLKPRTVANYNIYLNKHAGPALGNLKLDQVSTSDVAKLHRKVGLTRPMTANRIIECIGSVYRYAKTCGLVERTTNPAAEIEAFRENRRERFLSSEELSRLGESIRLAETVGIPWIVDETKANAKHIPKNRMTNIGIHVAASLRLLILTGARLREILNLRWEYVDFERGLLLLPDSKTGRKTIVLNAPALLILSKLPRLSEFVIVGEDHTKARHDLNRPWRLVAKRAGLVGVRLHDLRHTHASFGAAAGLGLPIIGKLLGHAQPSTTARYAHLDADPLRRASERIANDLGHAMGDIRPSGLSRKIGKV